MKTLQRMTIAQYKWRIFNISLDKWRISKKIFREQLYTIFYSFLRNILLSVKYEQFIKQIIFCYTGRNLKLKMYAEIFDIVSLSKWFRISDPGNGTNVSLAQNQCFLANEYFNPFDCHSLFQHFFTLMIQITFHT